MITKTQIIKSIEKEKETLRKIGISKIGLFGSFVKNKQNEKSDVDLLVEFNEISFDTYMKTHYFLEKITKRKVDLVIESDLKPELEHVKKEVEYVKI
ncbi:nucleotidyltransferase [Candidatus Pacearchaeota archaeon CG10_big_fil_rev_8_21_14_0_10_32_14]|nr:MAG: nucleotidyltransferase [Candidatus Pacearchaeota archaeon CG10_big_fil_rev_8_21_14_0_10_32_14]